MAGVALDWKTTKIAQNAGELYAFCAIPGAGSTLVLDATTGRPDSTQNPSCVHLGSTKSGSKISVKPSFQDFNVDEFRAPIARNITGMEMMLSAELVGVTDTALLELLTPGVGTKSTGTGFERVTFGAKALVYACVALVFPDSVDPTKKNVWMLYKAGNDSGIEFTVGRTELGFTPVNFKAYEITSRAVEDTIGQFNKQVA